VTLVLIYITLINSNDPISYTIIHIILLIFIIVLKSKVIHLNFDTILLDLHKKNFVIRELNVCFCEKLENILKTLSQFNFSELFIQISISNYLD